MKDWTWSYLKSGKAEYIHCYQLSLRIHILFWFWSETVLIAHQCFGCHYHGMVAKPQVGARPHAEGYKAAGLGLGLMHLQVLI